MFYLYLLIMIALLYSAHKATRLKGLLNAALWLAGTSCLTSILLFIMGSPGIAVIELSVGAGLVTVLFVFAISIVGDETIKSDVFVPQWLAALIAIVAFGMLAFLLLYQSLPVLTQHQAEIIAETIWVNRKADIFVQAALMVSGIFGILMLFAPTIVKKSGEKKHD